VRLCEHPDFDQAIQRAAVHFEARKDDYATDAQRETRQPELLARAF
jgi:hypothetical protein